MVDWQSESDLNSIRNSWDVFYVYSKIPCFASYRVMDETPPCANPSRMINQINNFGTGIYLNDFDSNIFKVLSCFLFEECWTKGQFTQRYSALPHIWSRCEALPVPVHPEGRLSASGAALLLISPVLELPLAAWRSPKIFYVTVNTFSWSKKYSYGSYCS